jgi:acyl carrier protein
VNSLSGRSSAQKNGATLEPTHPLAATVLQIVREIGRDNGRDSAVALDDSLIEDLGFDSLMFVDLTVLLEDRLGVEEFPMRSWADQESRLESGKRYTVRSLLRACVRIAVGSNV